MLCEYCGELEFNVLHHDTSLNTPIKPFASVEHYDECNYDADYQGEERGYVATMDCHEFEAGCSCEESGRCVVCIEQAVDHADHMRDAAKEG